MGRISNYGTLSDQEKKRIILLNKEYKVDFSDLGRRFNVSRQTIKKIIKESKC